MRLLLLLVLVFSFANAGGTETEEKLGAIVPLDLKFITDAGEEKTIKELMNGKPTLLTLNYYRCAGVCTIELSALADTLSKVELQEGKDYQVLTVSFLETETPALAKAKRKNILASITRPFTKSAWNFVVGQNGSADKLVDAVGFNFEESDLPARTTQYAHGTGVVVLSPEGKITRYLRGINQLPLDVKMAVLSAVKGEVTPSISKKLESCSDYHPTTEYVVPTEQIIGGIITFLALGFFLRLLLRGQKHKPNLTKEEYYRQEEEKAAQNKDDEAVNK